MTIKLYHGTYSDCYLVWSNYRNKRAALQIMDAEHKLFIRASVNLPKLDLPANHIFIKNYSENAGIMEELCRLGILDDTGITVPCGYTEANLCKILSK